MIFGMRPNRIQFLSGLPAVKSGQRKLYLGSTSIDQSPSDQAIGRDSLTLIMIYMVYRNMQVVSAEHRNQ
jgi:hypothetical protein